MNFENGFEHDTFGGALLSGRHRLRNRDEFVFDALHQTPKFLWRERIRFGAAVAHSFDHDIKAPDRNQIVDETIFREFPTVVVAHTVDEWALEWRKRWQLMCGNEKLVETTHGVFVREYQNRGFDEIPAAKPALIADRHLNRTVGIQRSECFAGCAFGDEFFLREQTA